MGPCQLAHAPQCPTHALSLASRSSDGRTVAERDADEAQRRLHSGGSQDSLIFRMNENFDGADPRQGTRLRHEVVG